MKVPFANLSRDEGDTLIEGTSVADRIEANIRDVCKRKNFVLGDYVQNFEKEFAKFCGVNHCVGVANGLCALEIALIASGVGTGDEVITVANTFNATVGAILKTGAQPILIDASEKDFNMDLNQVQKAITSKTKAIIPVHLYGQIIEMSKLMEIAGNIPVIEDACQAHGATYNLRKAGSFGLAGCFSFYPGKNLGGYGDGGAIVTDSKIIEEFARKTRNYGQSQKYHHEIRPDNSRLDTIQAAVLIEKLKVLDKWNSMRAENAELYRANLEGVKEIILPSERENGQHVYHLFVIKTNRREELEEHLKERGIDSGLHYPIPIHLQECFAQLGYKEGDFPISESLSKRILTLPLFPTMQEEEIKYVSNAIKDFYSKKSS